LEKENLVFRVSRFSAPTDASDRNIGSLDREARLMQKRLEPTGLASDLGRRPVAWFETPFGLPTMTKNYGLHKN